MEKFRMIQINRFEYCNEDATENLIRYITRTRFDEDRANELLLWGTASGYLNQKSVAQLIYEYMYVQKFYKAQGSLMCHYSLDFNSNYFQPTEETIHLLANCAVESCNYLFDMGHQTCFAIHYSPNKLLHIHFAINRINYRNGRKLRQYPTEIKKTIEYPIYAIFNKFTYTYTSFSEEFEFN